MRPKNFLLLFLVIALLLPQAAAAQLGRWSEDSEDLERQLKAGRFHPFLEFDYGSAKPKFEGLDGSFATQGIADLKLGYAALDSIGENLVSLDDRYAFVGFMGEDLRASGEPDEGDAGSELTRFGFGNRLGYGFGGVGSGIRMYNQNSLNWTQVRPVGYDTMDPETQAVFDRYETTYRFGQLMAAGVKVSFSRSLAVSVGAEGAVILPRTVFWPWLGSTVLYSGVQGGLQYFSEEIMSGSPVVGPILHFLLKSGVSYLYYAGLQDDMNWPFGGETPLTVEAAKLGLTYTF